MDLYTAHVYNTVQTLSTLLRNSGSGIPQTTTLFILSFGSAACGFRSEFLAYHVTSDNPIQCYSPS